MVEMSRRAVILGTAALGAGGAGVTAAASGLNGSVEGQADVQAEQALIVDNVSVSDDGDASFTRVSDDNTEFQAAVELNNGDTVGFSAEITNNADDALDAQFAVDVPDTIDVTVRTASDDTTNFGNNSSESVDDIDDNVDDTDADDDAAVKTGEGTFVANLATGETVVNIDAELDDTASPGSYDIGVAINPLSTDN
ncbi:hypothetical protein [Haloplanus natans]|uniref:hypothetical protein n=1 Tax=Haloplanus natans TaxID=376171 RepID=UPI0012F983CE|nr:hypothetical protein [Haloplanus natans]